MAGERQGADNIVEHNKPSSPLKEDCRRWEALRSSISDGEYFTSLEYAKELTKSTTAGSTYCVGYPYGEWNGILKEFKMTMIPKGMEKFWKGTVQMIEKARVESSQSRDHMGIDGSEGN